MEDKFLSHDWDKDASWKSYLDSVTIPDPSKQAEIIAKLKLKYYIKNIVRITTLAMFKSLPSQCE